MKKINLNEKVKVKLTDYGVYIYYHKHDDLIEFMKKRGLKPVEREMPKIDKDGFTEFQFHDFINTYGAYMKMGSENVIEDICIYMEDETLENV